MRPHRLVFASTLGATPAEVWSVVSTMQGVNHELSPWLRMTFPATRAASDGQPVPLGERLFRSWILFFGVLPVDYDDIVLVRVDSGRGFREESTTAMARSWIHERTIEATPGGCRITDQVELVPRPFVPGLLLGRVVGALFAHRHRRLRARFGG